ncbi:MAG: hypothetical protein AMS18_08170 [Gemmatimonas sp. SG8_17]|nr:MAG: hypothetical protein AMS18_08170 [Gemmatimonas sp. SG8_17]
MPILESDLRFLYTGAVSHDAAQTDPDASLGGYRSSSVITSAADNNVFDDVSGGEASAGDTEYRAIAFHNNHGTLALSSGKVWISADTGNAEDDVSFGVETPSPNETSGSIQTIADESTAPSGISWSDATSKATGLSFPGSGSDVAAGDWFGIWLRRIISAGAAASAGESCTLRIEGDSEP